MGWHGLPSPAVASTASDGVRLAIALFSAAIMMTILIVVVIIVISPSSRSWSGPRADAGTAGTARCGGVGTGPSRPGTNTAGGCSQFAKSSCGMI